ncbi:hypothetical protein AAG906_029771 [Vitis piasezkii]
MTALRAHLEQIIATQTQHTTILRQIQHHLGILSALEHAIPIPLEPSQAPSFVHQTMPPEEPTTREAEVSTPSIPTSTMSHHLHIILHHYPIICIVFFIYFVYVFPLCISFIYFLTLVALAIPCF